MSGNTLGFKQVLEALERGIAGGKALMLKATRSQPIDENCQEWHYSCTNTNGACDHKFTILIQITQIFFLHHLINDLGAWNSS